MLHFRGDFKKFFKYLIDFNCCEKFDILGGKKYHIKKEIEMEFKDSKTYQNLLEAFAGESMARNKYTYYASKARKDGYEQIAEIFEETANNEKEHAKMWFKALNGGAIGDTYENLLDAAKGENGEWTSMYKRMAQEAREEGYETLARQFEGVANIEKHHEERYTRLAGNIKSGKVYAKKGEVVWKCRNCGHIHVGKTAPVVCPVCAHPQSYFEVEERMF